jgi:hypothetical protein
MTVVNLGNPGKWYSRRKERVWQRSARISSCREPFVEKVDVYPQPTPMTAMYYNVPRECLF